MGRDDLRAAPTPQTSAELQGTDLEQITLLLPEAQQVKGQVQVTEEDGFQDRAHRLHLSSVDRLPGISLVFSSDGPRGSWACLSGVFSGSVFVHSPRF